MLTYIEDEITVILTVWKRDNYRLQLQHIINQTKKPYQIWIYQNESHVNVDISESEKKEFNISIIQSKDINFKFHGRFALPLLCDTEYTAIFDDDTIPQSRWLENCLSTSKRNNCIVGANGRTLNKQLQEAHSLGDGYAIEDETKVDFVGHCWFFKTEWCKNLWKDRPFSWDNGEDIHFAASCKIYEDINCFVPSMPSNDHSLWGDTMVALGMDDYATYRKNDHGILREKIIKHWVEKGWKHIYWNDE